MKHLLLSFLCLSVFACANVPYSSAPTIADVDYWEQQQRYTKALSVLKELNPEVYEPGLVEKRKSALRQNIQKIERNALTEVDRLLSKGQSMAAIQQINDALFQVPDSQKLSDKRELIIAKREARRRELQQQVFFKSAKSHLGSKKVYQQLADQFKDDRQSRQLLDQSKQQVSELNASLIELAKYYLQQDRYQQARQTLLMANQLMPSPEGQRLLDSVNQKTHSIRSAGGARARAFQQAESALASGDLMEARVVVNRFVAQFSGTPQAIDLESRLEQQIDKKIEHGLEQGRREYLQRNIQKALDIWRPLLLLRPGHEEITANIERAQRVLDKLEELTGNEP